VNETSGHGREALADRTGIGTSKGAPADPRCADRRLAAARVLVLGVPDFAHLAKDEAEPLREEHRSCRSALRGSSDRSGRGAHRPSPSASTAIRLLPVRPSAFLGSACESRAAPRRSAQRGFNPVRRWRSGSAQRGIVGPRLAAASFLRCAGWRSDFAQGPEVPFSVVRQRAGPPPLHAGIAGERRKWKNDQVRAPTSGRAGPARALLGGISGARAAEGCAHSTERRRVGYCLPALLAFTPVA
jgi:hypothetical protein